MLADGCHHRFGCLEVTLQVTLYFSADGTDFPQNGVAVIQLAVVVIQLVDIYRNNGDKNEAGKAGQWVQPTAVATHSRLA